MGKWKMAKKNCSRKGISTTNWTKLNLWIMNNPWDWFHCVLCHSRHVLEPWIQWLPNRVHNETNLTKLLHIHNVPSIENKRWFSHVVIHLLVIKTLELIPLGHNAHTICIFCCLVCIPNHTHFLLGCRTSWLQVNGVIPIKLVHPQIPLNLLLSHLRIIDAQACLVSK